MANLISLAMLALFGGAMLFGVWVLRAAVRIRLDHDREERERQSSLFLDRRG
jgi:hypothetical protein